MSVIQGGWGAIVGVLGGRSNGVGSELKRPRAISRQNLKENKVLDFELLAGLLQRNRVDLVRYFKEVIETVQIPELVVDDFAEDILLYMYQTNSHENWESVSFSDLLELGRCLILDKLMPQVRANFVERFKNDKQGVLLLDQLLEQARRAFLKVRWDPYLQSDWRAILLKIAEDIFKREFCFYARHESGLASVRVCDGKVKETTQIGSEKYDALETEDAAVWSNPLKLDAILKALHSGKTNPDFRHCIYRQFLSFNEKFSDALAILSLQIWESVSTKDAAFLHGSNHGAFRERCRARTEAMLNEMRVCAPLLEGENHE